MSSVFGWQTPEKGKEKLKKEGEEKAYLKL